MSAVYPKFADRIDNYTYFIYKMRHISICLTKKYINSYDSGFNEKLDFNIGDEVIQILSKSAVQRKKISGEYFSSNDILPVFSEKEIIPLHITFPLCTTMIIFSAISHCHSENTYVIQYTIPPMDKLCQYRPRTDAYTLHNELYRFKCQQGSAL